MPRTKSSAKKRGGSRGFDPGARVPVHAVSDRRVGKVRELYAERGIEITEEQAREVLQQSMWYFYQLWLGHEGLEEGSGDPPTTGSGPPEGTVPG